MSRSMRRVQLTRACCLQDGGDVRAEARSSATATAPGRSARTIAQHSKVLMAMRKISGTNDSPGSTFGRTAPESPPGSVSERTQGARLHQKAQLKPSANQLQRKTRFRRNLTTSRRATPTIGLYAHTSPLQDIHSASMRVWWVSVSATEPAQASHL